MKIAITKIEQSRFWLIVRCRYLKDIIKSPEPTACFTLSLPGRLSQVRSVRLATLLKSGTCRQCLQVLTLSPTTGLFPSARNGFPECLQVTKCLQVPVIGYRRYQSICWYVSNCQRYRKPISGTCRQLGTWIQTGNPFRALGEIPGSYIGYLEAYRGSWR